MKKLTYLLLFVALLFTLTIHPPSVQANGCSLDQPCLQGTPEEATYDRCWLSSVDCFCQVTEPRMCRRQAGSCKNANVIWEKWRCDSIACACEDGSPSPPEW